MFSRQAQHTEKSRTRVLIQSTEFILYYRYSIYTIYKKINLRVEFGHELTRKWDSAFRTP